MRRDFEFSVQPMEAERVWDADGVPILRARASLPQPSAENRRWRKIRAFYRLQSRAFFRYCQGELRPWAARECRAARENSLPMPDFRAELAFQETYLSGRRWSLYTELWENAAPGLPMRRRWGDVWDLATGYPVALSAFFPSGARWKRKLLAIAAEEMERREKRGLSAYYPAAPAALLQSPQLLHRPRRPDILLSHVRARAADGGHTVLCLSVDGNRLPGRPRLNA